MMNRPKQSNPHTNAVNIKSYNSADTHASKSTTSWLIHPLLLFAVKSSSCLPRLLVYPLKFAFNTVFKNSAHFFLRGTLFSFLFLFFHYICSFLVFFDIIRGKVLCLTTCFFLFFFLGGGCQIASRSKRKWRLWCHPFKRMEGRQTERQISLALIGLSSIRRQTQNFPLCKLNGVIRVWSLYI